MDKKVSIVIVTYNGLNRNWVEKCLGSLAKCNLLKDTIIVDNNSIDGTSDYIRKEFSESFLIVLNENVGFGRANNIGIKKAYEEGADYVFLLNQDAWIEPNTIELLVKAQQKEPDYGIISPLHLNGKGSALDYKFSNYIVPTKCQNLISDVFLNTLNKDIYELNFVNAAGWLLSRACLKKVGGFNPAFFHYGEDDNYIHRAHFYGFKIGVLPSAKICHDREDRANNMYFDDPLVIYKKTIILKLSNPLLSFSFDLEYKKLYKTGAKTLLSCNFKEFKVVLNRIKVLKSLDKKQIERNKIISMSINSAFINE